MRIVAPRNLLIGFIHEVQDQPNSQLRENGKSLQFLKDLKGARSNGGLFTTNHTDRTFFLWRLHLARPSHPGHSIIFCDQFAWVASAQSFTLWWQAAIEITCHDHPSCTLLLHSIVHITDITRDYMPRSLCYCMFVPRIYGCCSSRTSRLWWIARSMQRLQQYEAVSLDPSFDHNVRTQRSYVKICDIVRLSYFIPLPMIPFL